jgi:hypothetical protein
VSAFRRTVAVRDPRYRFCKLKLGVDKRDADIFEPEDGSSGASVPDRGERCRSAAHAESGDAESATLKGSLYLSLIGISAA